MLGHRAHSCQNVRFTRISSTGTGHLLQQRFDIGQVRPQGYIFAYLALDESS